MTETDIAGDVTHVLVVTGASGAGKTTIVRALDARQIPGVRCYYFDDIGVPSTEVMERDFGSGEAWQAAATEDWLTRLGREPAEIRIAVLDGQTRPSVVLAAAAMAAPRTVSVALLDCSQDVRDARLRGPRAQPELATPRMDNWAAYLRCEAIELNLPIIDTTTIAVAETTQKLEALVCRLLESDRK